MLLAGNGTGLPGLVRLTRTAALILLTWSGETVANTVSIEVKIGERLQDWCGRLENRGVLTCSSVLKLAATEEYAEHTFVPPPTSSPTTRALPQSTNRFEGNRFEGLLPPGRFEVDDLDTTATPQKARALDNARKVIAFLLEKGAERLEGLSASHGLTAQEQIILASVVEKEAAANADYGKIAAVFYNRLKAGDTLGSCPAVEYALGFHRPFLLYKDLEAVSSSPYNLYEKVGLPPTPIGFFSDSALQAVKDPLVDDSIYFFVFDWTTGQLNFERRADYDKHRANAARAKENYRLKYGDIRKVAPDKYYQE